jgi:iron(III) transport system substrate-binding protein
MPKMELSFYLVLIKIIFAKTKFLMKNLWILLLFTFSCNSEKIQTLNVFTSRHYDSDIAIYEAFEKETGIKIEVKQGKDDELIRTIEEQGEKTQADLLITADAARLYRAKEKGLFAKLNSRILKQNLATQFLDEQWVALTYRARIIAYLTEKVQPNLDYGSLASGKYKVLVRSSENIYNQSLVAWMLVKYGEEAAENWAKGVVSSMARPPQGNDTDQIKALSEGKADLALVNSYYFFKLLSTEPQNEEYKKIGLVFPNPTHINVSGGGIIKYSKNQENALKFLEFLSRSDIQEKFAGGNFEYPVNPQASVNEILKNFPIPTLEEMDFNLLGQYNTAAAQLLDRAGWK